MSEISSRLYNFAVKFICALMVIFSGLLFFSAFFSTCFAEDMTTQQVLARWDNPFFSIVLIVPVMAALGFFSKRVCKKDGLRLNYLLIICCLWVLFWGAALILFSKTVPAADAMSVYSIAESLAINDTSVIHPTESYLSYYPQQVGLVAFFEILIRIWNLLPFDLPAYHMIKCVYVLLACVIILLQFGITRLLWHDGRAEGLYIILAAVNLPFIMYTSFVYGEIPSFAALCAGMYFYLKLVLNDYNAFSVWINCALSLCFLVLSVFLRKNSLIMIIAVVIVTIFQILIQKNKRAVLSVFALLSVTLSLSVLPLTEKYYELRSGNEINSGVTALSYLAMGMQESSRGNGWYNGFNFNTYKDSGMDTDIANRESRDAISERLEYFKQNPIYALNFYLGKYNSQWTDGTYASRQATLATFGGRKPFFDSLYMGKGSRFFIEYGNIYQNVIYLGLFIFCIMEVRSKKVTVSPHYPQNHNPYAVLPAYLGLIGVFGGFLFHMIWEANSRYIFLYSLLLMPYAAKGIAEALR